MNDRKNLLEKSKFGFALLAAHILWLIPINIILNLLINGSFFHATDIKTELKISLSLSEFANLFWLLMPLFLVGLVLPKTKRRLFLGLSSWLLLAFFSFSWASFANQSRFLSFEYFRFFFSKPIQMLQHLVHLDWLSFAFILLAPALVAIALVKPLNKFLTGPRINVLTIIGIAIFVTASIAHWYGNAQYSVNDSERSHASQRFDFYSHYYRLKAGPATVFLTSIAKFFSADSFGRDWRDQEGIIRRKIAAAKDYPRNPPIGKPNFVLILVESLRRDQLEVYGGDPKITPTLNQLAKNSAVFTNAYGASSHSHYADVVPLSAQYPLRSSESYYYHLPITYPRVLIYDLLKNMGYQTSIISSQDENWAGMLNFLQTENIDYLVHAGGKPENPEFAGSGKLKDSYTIDQAIRWMRADRAPFFSYINLQTSHIPYTVPADHNRRFTGGGEQFRYNFQKFDANQARAAKPFYSETIAYIDHQIGRLINHLKSVGQFENTVFIVSADTATAFLEHNIFGNAAELFDEVVKVPLLIHGPSVNPQSFKHYVSHLDIPSTILEMIGLKNHPAYQGLSLFDPSPRSIFLVSQTVLLEQYGVIKDGFKFMTKSRDSKFPMLFDLRTDPRETKNLIFSNKEKALELERLLLKWRRVQIGYYQDELAHYEEYVPIIQ